MRDVWRVSPRSRLAGAVRSAPLRLRICAGRFVLAAVRRLARCFGGTAPAALAEEAIENFRADIAVARDGTVHVVETIRVRAEGNQIRRGIFRDVSTTFEDAEGKVHRVGFELLGLTRDGRPEPYHTERYSDFLRIYAGDEDVFLDTGSYTYVLTYETDRQIRWFDDKPELFWNVTGNDWSFPILKASASLKLPDGVAPVAWDAYTGSVGERGSDWQGAVGGDGRSERRDHAPARAGRGADHRRRDSGGRGRQAERGATMLRYFLLDHREWFIGVVGLLVVLAYYLWAWNKVGRDPKGGTIIPLFHPPEGVSAALASYIRNWGFGANAWKAFTASALSLAVRGLLVFDQEGKDLVLERTKASADGIRDKLPPARRPCSTGSRSRAAGPRSTRPTARPSPRSARRSRASVRKESGGRYFKTNILHFVVGVVLSILTIGAIVVFGQLCAGGARPPLRDVLRRHLPQRLPGADHRLALRPARHVRAHRLALLAGRRGRDDSLLPRQFCSATLSANRDRWCRPCSRRSATTPFPSR